MTFTESSLDHLLLCLYSPRPFLSLTHKHRLLLVLLILVLFLLPPLPPLFLVIFLSISPNLTPPSFHTPPHPFSLSLYLSICLSFTKCVLDVVIPHLRAFLSKHNASQPLQFGRRFFFEGSKSPKDSYYSGGGGIVLSRGTLTILGDAAEKDPSIWAGPSSGAEDQLLSKTLVVNFGIYPVDTRDSDGKHVFGALGLEPERMYFRKTSPDLWYWRFSPDAKEGKECCSSHWITSHYMKMEQVWSACSCSGWRNETILVVSSCYIFMNFIYIYIWHITFFTPFSCSFGSFADVCYR